MPPKSAKLQREEAAAETSTPFLAPKPEKPTGPIRVRRIDCCNDFVAVLQTQVETSIELAGTEAKFKNEGLVVGVGPGVSDGAGGRLKPCVEIGDYITFGGRNIVQRIESNSPPYKGMTVVILSERNVISKLPTKIEWVDYVSG